MSVLVEFIEWIKQESRKSDDAMLEDARIIGRQKIAAVLDAISYRGRQPYDSESDRPESVSNYSVSPSTVNISPLRIESVNTASPEEVIRAILGSPESDVSIDKDSDSFNQTAKIGQAPISPISQGIPDNPYAAILQLLEKFGPVSERRFRLSPNEAELKDMFFNELPKY
jgi:hypothetical protein